MIEDLLQPTHLLVLAVVALLVFGPKRLPEIGRTVGKALREFRHASSGLADEVRSGLAQPDEAPPPVDEQQPLVAPRPKAHKPAKGRAPAKKPAPSKRTRRPNPR